MARNRRAIDPGLRRRLCEVYDDCWDPEGGEDGQGGWQAGAEHRDVVGVIMARLGIQVDGRQVRQAAYQRRKSPQAWRQRVQRRQAWRQRVQRRQARPVPTFSPAEPSCESEPETMRSYRHPTMPPPPSPSPDPMVSAELERVLIIPDVHAPFHDREAWATMMAAAKSFRPHVIVVLGDFFDFYAVSRHDKNPNRVTKLSTEILDACDLLDELDELGAARKVFCEGNHEQRFSKYLARHAPAMFDFVSFEGVVGLGRRGWEFVPYKHSGRVGDLLVTHDLDKQGVYAGLHASKDAGCSAAIGHVHRVQMQVTGDHEGRPVFSACFGWLAQREAATEYKHESRIMREWPHGFGLGYVEPSGAVHLRPVVIHGGACVVEGRLIRRPGSARWAA